MWIGIKVNIFSTALTHFDIIQMGLLCLCVTFLTLLLLKNWVYSAVSCPSGDTSGIVKNGQTCSQLILSANYECYNATIEASCCASCNATATGISGCQYGDKVANCIVVLCPFYTDPSECCSTCRTTTTATTTSTAAATTTTKTATTTTTTTTTTTATPLPAENITTGSTSQASSSLSTSASVIAGAVVGSIAGASLLAGLTYAGIHFFKGAKVRRVVSSSTVHEDIIDNENDENSDENADSHNATKKQVNGAIPVPFENGDILGKNKSLPPLEAKVSDLPQLSNMILSKPPLLTTTKT